MIHLFGLFRPLSLQQRPFRQWFEIRRHTQFHTIRSNDVTINVIIFFNCPKYKNINFQFCVLLRTKKYFFQMLHHFCPPLFTHFIVSNIWEFLTFFECTICIYRLDNLSLENKPDNSHDIKMPIIWNWHNVWLLI